MKHIFDWEFKKINSYSQIWPPLAVNVFALWVWKLLGITIILDFVLLLAVCGTDDTPLMGTGCIDDGKDVQHVCGQCGVLFDVCYPIGASYIEPMNN